MTHELTGLRAPTVEELLSMPDFPLAMVDIVKFHDASKAPLSHEKKVALGIFSEVTVISVDCGMVRYRFVGSERTGMASVAAITRNIDDPDPSHIRYVVPNW